MARNNFKCICNLGQLTLEKSVDETQLKFGVNQLHFILFGCFIIFMWLLVFVLMLWLMVVISGWAWICIFPLYYMCRDAIRAFKTSFSPALFWADKARDTLVIPDQPVGNVPICHFAFSGRIKP